MSVLIIDDEPSVLNALTLLLKAIGYEARGLNNPQEALQLLRSPEASQIDLILCDLRMPELNGFEVLKEVRNLHPDLLFVLISAHADEDDVQKALGLGANGFLGKPFSPDEFHELYKELCGQKEAENS